jgi:hypothetical protein
LNLRTPIFALLFLGVACSAPPPAEPDVGVPSDVGEPGAVYVNETAPPGGDGSALAPFQSVDEALAALRSAAWVILAPGSYAVTQVVELSSVRIDGAGPDLTSVAGASALAVADQLEFDSLTLFEPETLASARIVLTGVDISGPCSLNAASLSLDGTLMMEGALSMAAAELSIVNFDAERSDIVLSADNATVNGFDVRDTPGPALTIQGPGTWTIEDLEITDIGQELEEPNGDAGVCLVIDSATVVITDLSTLRCAWRGVAVRGAANVEITDSTVAGVGNTAVSSQSGATLVIEGMEVSDASVLLFANEATIEARGVIAERSRNAAVLTGPSSTVTITESTFLDSPNGHISILGPDTTAQIRENVFDGTDFESCFSAVGTEGRIEFSGNTVRNCASGGVTISNGSNFLIFDNEISNIFGVEPLPDIAEGVLAIRAVAEVRDNAIHDVGGAGVAFLNSGGTIAGNVISGTGDAGVRLVERGDTELTVSGNTVFNAVSAGIAALTVDVTIVDNDVTNTSVSLGTGFGEGILLASQVTMTVSDNRITGSAYNGIRFVDGVAGTIDGNAIRDSGLNDIQEDCGPFEPNEVTIGENDLEGEASVCD